MRLVFCGTPQFAVPTLRAALAAGHQIELVLSQPDRPSGRGLAVQLSPVKQFAVARQLPIWQPEKIRTHPELQQRLIEIAPDAILVVAYGRIIPQWMLDLPRYGNLNLHASLLPKYRGAAPIQWAIAKGETETGVTTMRIDAGLDTGDTLLMERVPISPDQTAPELATVLAEAGAELMLRTLAGLAAGTLRAAPQKNEAATLAPILTREDGRVDWNRCAAEVYNRWRGFFPWPGAWTSFRGKKLNLLAMQVAQPAVSSALPGTIVRQGQRLRVVCGDETAIEPLEVQLEGKRRMPPADFLNGISLAPGERLG